MGGTRDKPAWFMVSGMHRANILLAHGQLRKDFARCEQIFDACWWWTRFWIGLFVVCLCTFIWLWLILFERTCPPGDEMCPDAWHVIDEFMKASNFESKALLMVSFVSGVAMAESFTEGWHHVKRSLALYSLLLEYRIMLGCMSYTTEYAFHRTITRRKDLRPLLCRRMETMRNQLSTRLAEVKDKGRFRDFKHPRIAYARPSGQNTTKQQSPS